MEHKKKGNMKALDLFCGAGGVSMGLHRAGFDVTGVDIKPQPRYPFGFIQDDAMTFPLEGFDFIWASPPCQHYTQMLNHGQTNRNTHPDLVAAVRDRLRANGRPYVIENVNGAPLLAGSVMLCGEMFGLRVMRHRYFEAAFALLAPTHPAHDKRGARRKDGDGGHYLRVYGHETGKGEWGEAMGIDWMKSPELAQAIPPAYSEFIGKAFLNSVELGR